MAQKRIKAKTTNPFLENTDFYGEMTVWQLVELVQTDEFPKGLDTKIRIGDVEGNLGIVGEMTLVAHKPGDVVLAIDPHGGDEDYDPEEA